MRRPAFAFIAALLLLASPARAVNRVAVMIDGTGTASSGTSATTTKIVLDLLDRNGVAYDKFYAGARTWGQSGVADSTWFRQNYAAVIIPYLDGGTLTPFWGTKFLNAAASGGTNRSPLSGLWGLPVYVTYLATSSLASGAFDETIDLWVPGSRASAGIRNRPAQATRGTWGYKMLARLRGDRVDTLYTDASRHMCIYADWLANAGAHGSVAALVWADTSNSAGWSCTATDTMAPVWRFRPSAGKPGITYSTLPVSLLTMDGILALLQMCYAQTDAEPEQTIGVPIIIHNDYAGGSLNATAKVHVRAIHDTLLANGIPWSIQLAQTSATDYAGTHDADTRAELRRVLADTRAFVTWAPGSNGTGHTLAHYTAAETAEVRKAFNADMNTAARPDSFGLPRARMSVDRYVSASGLVGAYQLKVLADAGVKVIESTSAAPVSAGWAVLGPQGGSGKPVPWKVPFAGDSRVVWSAGTIGITDGASFSSVRGSTTENDWVGSNVTQRISWAAQTNSSLYWHMSTNVTGTDGYFRWFASVLARHFKFYDRVIEPVSGARSTQVVQAMESP